jgi:hypothetical protein
MSSQEISLKTVNDLRLSADEEPQRFFIAAYQRGYRWSPLQVTQLLDDLREFTKRRNPQPDEFYCLQPLVLKAQNDGSYEVVDGQQRLTTLLLVLRHFNERLAAKYRQPLYSLAYETRPQLAEFLAQPVPNLAESNVDFFHIAQAIRAIEQWFARLRELLFLDDRAYLYRQPDPDKDWAIQEMDSVASVVEEFFLDVFHRKAGLGA